MSIFGSYFAIIFSHPLTPSPLKTLSVVVTFQDKKYNWTFAHEALKSLFLNTLLYVKGIYINFFCALRSSLFKYPPPSSFFFLKLSHNLLKKLPTLIGIADSKYSAHYSKSNWNTDIFGFTALESHLVFVNPEALPDDTVASSNASLLARPSTSTSTSNTKTAISAGAVAAAAVAVTSTTSAGSSVAGSEAASLTVALPDQAALDEIEYLEKLNGKRRIEIEACWSKGWKDFTNEWN